MPYITEDRRIDHDPLCMAAETSGELNYQITTLLVDYVLANGLSYQVINDIQGALRNAGVEFDRRIVGTYEDEKIEANGDVYGPVLTLLRAPKGRGSQQAGNHAQDGTEAEADTERSPRRGCDGSCGCQGRYGKAQVRP